MPNLFSAYCVNEPFVINMRFAKNNCGFVFVYHSLNMNEIAFFEFVSFVIFFEDHFNL